MKKIFIPIYSVLIIALITLFLISNKKILDYEFYTIKENHSYVYGSDKRMTLNVYSKTKKPLIYYEKENTYTIKLDTFSYKLKDIDINGYEYDDYYLIKIESEVPNITDDEYFSDKFILEISNQKYDLSLDLGTLSILNPNHINLVSVNYLSGIYTYNDNMYDLVGLNITFTDKYDYINDIRIGGYTYGCLQSSKINLKFNESIIEIKDYIEDYKFDYEIIKQNIFINNKTIFIPLSYIEFNLIRKGYIVFTLDYVDYYFDLVTFMSITPSIEDYKERVIKGDMNA